MEVIHKVKGVEYIVSSDGKVFSTKNIGRGKYHKEIKQRINKDGYCMITVGLNKQRTAVRVHRIVAEAFIPNPLNLPEVDHINNNRQDNRVENLRWISSFENKSIIPFENRSKSRKGEKNGRALLTREDVSQIRQMYSEGVSVSDIAKLYQRGWSTINNIIRRNTWK